MQANWPRVAAKFSVARPQVGNSSCRRDGATTAYDRGVTSWSWISTVERVRHYGEGRCAFKMVLILAR